MSRFYLYGGNLTNGIEQGLAPYDSVEECLSAVEALIVAGTSVDWFAIQDFKTGAVLDILVNTDGEAYLDYNDDGMTYDKEPEINPDR